MKKIIIPIIILIIAFAGVVYYFLNNIKDNSQQFMQEYFSKINEEKYTEMYQMLDSESKSKISEENFVLRNKNIYSRNRYVKFTNFDK